MTLHSNEANPLKHITIIFLAILFSTNLVFGQTAPQLDASEISQLASFGYCSKLPIEPDKSLFEKYEQAIAIQPKNIKLYLERAKCFKIINDYSSVLKDVSIILNLQPHFDSLFYDRLSDLFWSKKPDEVRSRVESLIISNKNHFFPYQMRSVVKIWTNDNKGAFEDYLKAVELEPLASMNQFGVLGNSLNGLRDDKNIIEYYDRVFKVYEKILQEFSLKIQQNEDDSRTLFQMKGISMQIGNVLHAFSMNLADLYIEKGETEKSRAVLDKMVQIPPLSMAYLTRSNYYKRKGNLQKAEADNIKSIEVKIEAVTEDIENKNTIKPRKAYYFILRGDYFLELKQPAKAIADYEMAKSLDQTLTAKSDEKIKLAQKFNEENNPPK
jgi:tetratricopeptide (TPR) repeat protein